MNRRVFVATVGAGTIGISAGCIGNVLDDLTTYEATPAEVSDDVLEETGYEHDETEERVEEESVASEPVEVTSYVSEYIRTIDLTILGLGTIEAGVFGTIATPQVEVAGDDHNPVGEMGPRELVELVQGRYEELSVDTENEVDERQLEAVSQTISVSTFEGTAALDDEDSVDVFVDLSQPDHGEDHLVFAGVYPRDIPDEDDRIDALIEGVEHGDG